MPTKKEAQRLVGGLSQLKPRKVNPRTMSDEDRARLSKTLKEFGDLSGLVRNVRTDGMVGGHQRLEEFRKDKKAIVELELRLDKPDTTGTVGFGYVLTNGTRYSYREVDWDEAKEAAANLAANRVHGEFDWEQVSAMLHQLPEGFDFGLTGFPEHELENLRQAEWAPPEREELAAKGTGTIDAVHLTKSARKALNRAKAILKEPDDAAAVEKVALEFAKGGPPRR